MQATGGDSCLLMENLMSLITFRRRLHESTYGENDRKWFPRWLARYVEGKTQTNKVLPVTKPLIVEFSKSLLKSGTPALQRLQGVRLRITSSRL